MARKKKIEGEAFVLVRRGWEESYGNEWSFLPVQAEEDRALGRSLAAFTDRASAEARKAELEREARAELAPFQFLGEDVSYLRHVTSLPPVEFEARLKAMLPGIRLPPGWEHGGRDWVGWWEKVADRLTEEQRAAVWGLFDRLEFYAVVPVEVE